MHLWKGPTNWAGPLPPYLDKIQKNSILSLWGRPWARPLDQEESQPRVNAWHRPKYIALVSCRKRKGQEHILSDFNTLGNLVLSEILNTWVQRPRRLNKLTESSISNLLVLKPLRDPCKPTTENSRLLVWSLGTFQPFAPRFSAVTTRVANPWPAQCQTNLGRSCSAKQ